MRLDKPVRLNKPVLFVQKQNRKKKTHTFGFFDTIDDNASESTDDSVDEDCELIPESSKTKSLLLPMVSLENSSVTGLRESNNGRLGRPDLVLSTLFNVRLLTSDDTFTGLFMFMWTRIKPSNVQSSCCKKEKEI